MVVVDRDEHLHYADYPVMVAEPVVPVLRGDATVKWVNDQLFGLEFLSVPLSVESRLKKFLSRSSYTCS